MNVTVMLLTYERTDYALATLRAMFDNLHFSGDLRLHIADDGSSEGHRIALQECALSVGCNPTFSVTPRGGYGMNYNRATNIVHDQADFVLPLEDDWELTRPLDLDPLVAALNETEQFGCIRMGYIGYTQELRGRFVSAAGQQYLVLDPESPEPHVWSGNPRLETVAWQRKVGLWPEGLTDPGAVEFAVAHIPEARFGVAWPVDLIHPRGDMFAHIGTIRSVEVQEATI